MLSQGNCASVKKNYELVAKTINKKDKTSHVISVHSNFAYFSAFDHHVSQTMNLKKENVMLCWDGFRKSDPLDWAIYSDGDIEKEPPVTFWNYKDEIS
jgi:hypothetical protein